MCTVTYIPQSQENSFILTSNRDEKEFRPTIAPKRYKHPDIDLVYPEDEKAGGSWIAINNRGRVSCLLNGGVVAHQKQAYHTQSRGNVLIEFTSSNLSVTEFFISKKLPNVEPFTIVAIEYSDGVCHKLTEFIWDGENKNFSYPDKNEPHIWSSVTLYNEEHRRIRRAWFDKFCKENNDAFTPEKTLRFHSGYHTDDNEVNVVMQRDGGLKTVSITQVSPSGLGLKMRYSDLLNGNIDVIEL
jgi:hypothetical protein